MPATPQNHLSGTTLIRSLSTLGVTEPMVDTGRFAERMSQLIGLSDAINIAQAQRNVAAGRPACNNEISAAALREKYQTVADGLGQMINEAFHEQERTNRRKLPALGFSDGNPDPAPFLSFYRALQQELDYRIAPLWSNTREAVKMLSGKLAQLAAIDTALGESLAPHSRKLFAEVPRLLQLRFQQLASEADGNNANTGEQHSPAWLGIFLHDMEVLLLAELEVRLLPVVGLLEAAEHEVDKPQ